MNLADYISSLHQDSAVIIISTHCQNGLTPFSAKSKKIKIVRLGASGPAMPAVKRYLNYLYFYLGAFLLLLFRRPGVIIYYETLSAYPAYLYKKYISGSIPLFIHYHEYTSPGEYAAGMKLVRYFHQKEKKLYPGAAWISHTNEGRMSRFLADEGLVRGKNIQLLPNYPSELWCLHANKSPVQAGQPLKIVYAGAVSMDTMYIEAFANWVKSKQGQLLWDIYSNNITAEAGAFFNQLQTPFIRLLHGVNYGELAGILPNYQVGIILYNGHIPNYVLNAPNKLFEYLACGLDVWYPDVMTGCTPYNTTGTYPVVKPLDFLKLGSLQVEQLTNRDEYTHKVQGYFYEHIYAGLMQHVSIAIKNGADIAA